MDREQGRIVQKWEKRGWGGSERVETNSKRVCFGRSLCLYPCGESPEVIPEPEAKDVGSVGKVPECVLVRVLELTVWSVLSRRSVVLVVIFCCVNTQRGQG